MKNLVIVESPTKAKTISKFLGKDYAVESSYGHMRDLPSKEMGVDIEKNFVPKYVIIPDAKDRAKELKELAAKAEIIYYATDEDREGEAIAWHLSQILHPKAEKEKRITFHEITKGAIENALKNPRDINIHLVDSQQARRILDRLVGYELSPILWRKVQIGLSAGRVQSVAVRLVVEREREIENFESESQYKVTATFILEDGSRLHAELKNRFPAYEEVKDFLQKLVKAEFSVSSLEKKPGKKSPAPPFTTSTLQQEASRKLGFSAKQTMVIAQKLYEHGKITYMRTDSLNLSETALTAGAQLIKSEFGPEYVHTRQYKTKSKGAQEAHEAIRPTDMALKEITGDYNQQRLYDLIWKRTLASQMADAKIEKTVATIQASTVDEVFIAQGSILTFEGFLKVYTEGKDDDEENGDEKILPPLREGQKLKNEIISARQVFKRPPPRYSEASLVKKLEELGIGRPSTYAPTLSTVQQRGYVERTDKEGKERDIAQIILQDGKISETQEKEKFGEERRKLFPTDVGRVVNDFLVKHFPVVVDFDFTAKIEAQFDEIANGKEDWKKMLKHFYGPFHETVEKSKDISRKEASSQRLLGNDPKNGKPVYARIGRYGPMLQIGEKEDAEKPRFAPIPKGKSLENITLEEALPLFDLPYVIGANNAGEEVSTNIGRFGPYIKCGKIFVSIKEEELFTLSLDEAIKRIHEKEELKKNKTIQTFEDEKIKVLNGRYGPYVTDGAKNAKIPKDMDPKKLTLEQCKELIIQSATKPRRRKISKT